MTALTQPQSATQDGTTALQSKKPSARRGKVKPPKPDNDPWIGTAHVKNLIEGAKT